VNQSVEANEAPPVKRLDGEVTKLRDIAFAGGVHCEVWRGVWERGSGEGIDEKKVGDKGLSVEKVSLSLTA